MRRPVFRWWLLLTGCAQIALEVIGALHRPGSWLYDYAWRTESLAALVGLVLVTGEAVGWNFRDTYPTTRRQIATCLWVKQSQYGTQMTDSREHNPASQFCPLGLAAQGRSLRVAAFVRKAVGLCRDDKKPEADGPSAVLPSQTGGSGRPQLTAALAGILTLGVLAILYHRPVWPGFWLEPVFVAVCGVNCWCGLVLMFRWRTVKDNLMVAILAAWCLLNAAIYSGAARSIDRIGLAGEILNCAALLGWTIIGQETPWPKQADSTAP